VVKILSSPIQHSTLKIAPVERNPRLKNLKEAVALFLENASPSELEGRLSEESWITQFETEYAHA
jgi:hypothetical protein